MRQCRRFALRDGLIYAEVVISVILFGMIVGFSAAALLRYRDVRDHTAWRRAAAWAAAAQLQRYRAGIEFDTPPPAGLISESIALSTTVESANEPWTGFSRVTVTATVARGDQTIARESVSGYVRTGGSP